jgi:hypothetical protein
MRLKMLVLALRKFRGCLLDFTLAADKGCVGVHLDELLGERLERSVLVS